MYDHIGIVKALTQRKIKS